MRIWSERGARLALPLLLILLLATSPVTAQDQGPNRAGLVIVHGDGRVTTRCVGFDEPQITGLTLLNRSGLSFAMESGPTGSTLCTLDGEGCPASDCFCECKGTPCVYWNYFQRTPDGAWIYSGVGAAARQLSHGDVDGWVWGDGSTAPPAVSFDAICASTPSDPPATPTTLVSTATIAPPSPTAAPPTVTPSSVPTVPPDPSPTAVITTTPSPEAAASASPTATVTPTSTVAPISTSSPTPVATPSPTATVSSVPPPIPTEAPAVDTDQPAAEPDTWGTTAQYLAFAVLLALIGVALVVLRQRRS